MVEELKLYTGSQTQLTQAINAARLDPYSMYIIGGSQPVLSLSNHTVYTFVDKAAVIQLIEQYGGGSGTGGGEWPGFGTTPGRPPTSTGAPGTEGTASRSDHEHVMQTTIVGNAGTASRLQTTRTIRLTGNVTGNASFNGTEDCVITTVVNPDLIYDGPDHWIGPSSQLPVTRDSNTIYFVYED